MRGLAALSALARHGRHERAAEALGISRSAVSHRIADLEQELGVVLVVRTGRASALTEEALAILAAMGDALDRIESAVAPLHRRRHQVRLSTVSTFASNWLLPRLPDFQADCPEIDLVLTTTQRVIDLEHEDVDCAIRHGLGQWKGLRASLLFRETLVPVAAPGLAEDGGRDWPVVRARTRFHDWPSWWRAAKRPGEPPTRGIVVENRGQALEAALAGAGVVLTDLRYVERLIESGRLVRLGPVIDMAEGYYFVRMSVLRNARHIEQMERWLIGQAGSAAFQR